MDHICIPGTAKFLVDGSIVILQNDPDTKWVVHCGWYKHNDDQELGWYLCKIPTKETKPLTDDDLNNCIIVYTPKNNRCVPPPQPVPDIHIDMDMKNIDADTLRVSEFAEIHGVLDPESDSDAANKHYVDDQLLTARGYYLDKKKVADYLYELWYSDIDYDYAERYFKENEDPVNEGGCSAVRKGNLFGRNLDWYYDNSSEFLVHIPAIGSRNASIGFAGGFNKLTKEYVESNSKDLLFKVVPFRMRDGINDKGLVVSMNVVPTDKGKNKSVPSVSLEKELCGEMVVRFILDNFATAQEAAEYIRDYVSIYFSIGTHQSRFEYHWMVADATDTYLIEVIDNSNVISQINNHPYMTNFYLSDVTLNDDGTVYTPATQTESENAMDTNNITEYGSGLERYNLINSSYENIEDETSMINLMKSLYYTHAYNTSSQPADPYWYTEFVGNGLTCASPTASFDGIIQYAGNAFIHRERSTPLTWQTTHTAVYNIEDKSLSFTVQENETLYSRECSHQYVVWG